MAVDESATAPAANTPAAATAAPATTTAAPAATSTAATTAATTTTPAPGKTTAAAAATATKTASASSTTSSASSASLSTAAQPSPLPTSNHNDEEEVETEPEPDTAPPTRTAGTASSAPRGRRGRGRPPNSARAAILAANAEAAPASPPPKRQAVLNEAGDIVASSPTTANDEPASPTRKTRVRDSLSRSLALLCVGVRSDSVAAPQQGRTKAAEPARATTTTTTTPPSFLTDEVERIIGVQKQNYNGKPNQLLFFVQWCVAAANQCDRDKKLTHSPALSLSRVQEGRRLFLRAELRDEHPLPTDGD